ncbi:MAG: DUF5908 family protein [Aequorivita antarctica]
MAIEIRELIIKVKIEEPVSQAVDKEELLQLKNSLLKECKKEIKKQFNKHKER